jgi:hypothetical protein
MVKLSTFQDQTRKITVDVGGESINLTVRPYGLLPEHEFSDDPQALLDAFVAMVQEWDVTDDDGVMIPIEKEVLISKVGSLVIVGVMMQARDQVVKLGK